ncbi:MAG: hypothetical protein HY736_18935 [Verrucomicrobia bacterium]|nr:hypothetical protein [Verrucomicrobiota bacterium]
MPTFVRSRPTGLVGVSGACVALALAQASAGAAEPSGLELRELVEQNRRLQEQVRAQQKTIDEMSARMAEVLKASERHDRELRSLQDRPGVGPASTSLPVARRDQEVRISAEAGLAFFNTGREGQFPKAEFRVDDPVISVEAPVGKNVYLFAELKLLTRETNVENFQLGELYVDFEDVSAAWGRSGQLGFRAGRLNVPFGEEYQLRGPIANPLISRSLSDIWGVDEGVEIYGKIGPARYVVAVQNGGVSRLRDFNADKSVAARVGWEPAPWLHVSGSAMRTGELATVGDNLSELWFANAFFRALGPAASTGKYWVNLFEGDATARWKDGHVSAALGQARFDDSDTRADNSRRIRYGYLEMVQGMADRLYGAARYSEIRAPRGYPLAGWGQMGMFFFRPSLTEELRRFSLGLGYRFGPSLVLKTEYTWENGRMTNGARREREDFFGSEIGVKF